MSVFYRNGETKKRPGVYRLIVDISKIKGLATSANGWAPEWDDALTAFYNEVTRTLTLSSDKITVTHNGIATVTVKGLSHSHDAGVVTIGG